MKRSLNFKIAIIFVLSLIPVFYFLNSTGPLGGVKNFFYSVSLPIEKALWGFGGGMSDFISGIFEINSFQKEIEYLRSQNRELLAQIAGLKEIRTENDVLRKALDIGLEKDFKLDYAEIIGKDPSKDSLLIDRGQKDGISKGLPVLTSQKTLLGRIGEVYKNFSEVMLISNKDSSFDAKIIASPVLQENAEKEIYGLVRGKGGLKLYFDLVPKEIELTEGELVITASLGGIFPKGILVGSLSKIEKSDADPFQKAEINPDFKLQEINSVFIIKGFKE